MTRFVDFTDTRSRSLELALMMSNGLEHKMRVAVLFTLTCLGGCGVPYPIYKTLQPASQLTVLDRNMRPIEAAEVTLISVASPSYMATRRDSRDTKFTNVQGIVTFESKNEWRIETLMIHGGEIFSWSWCVQKSGFISYRSIDSFLNQTIVQLHEGQSTSCRE